MRRSIVTCILLSIVTCGIYSIYWMIQLNDELNAANGRGDAPTGGMVFLLTLVTCGIYGFYWYYKMGENVDAIKTRSGEPSSSSPLLYLVVGLLGFSVINYCLMQDCLNKHVAA